MASKTEEGAEVAHHFASPLVLRSLVDRLASYTPPPPTGTNVVSTRIGKYGAETTTLQPPPVLDPSENAPQATVTEDLVIKLLASIMVHPQQGQRARLVLKDELPEDIYMSLHQAGSIPADIKIDSVTVLPPLPDRDTEHKVYPKVNPPAEGEVLERKSAVGVAVVPESLAVPLRIVVTPPVEDEVVEDVEASVEEERNSGTLTVVSGEQREEAQEEYEERTFVRESRAASLKRCVVAALSPSPHHQRTHENSGIPSGSPNCRDAGTPRKGKPRGKGPWHRSSASLTSSPSNGTSSGNGTSSASSTTTSTVQQQRVPEEKRPMTLPSPQFVRGRALSWKKSAEKAKSGERSSTLSPSGQGTTTKSRSSMTWAAVAAALSPGLSPSEHRSPKS